MRPPSKILDAVHQTATGLHKSGTITDVTMREFDKLCLHPLQPEQIKKLREKAKWYRANVTEHR